MTSSASNFFFPISRRQFLDKLERYLQQSGMVAIEGQMGIGKTVIIEEVLTSSLYEVNKCYITASKNINDIQVRSRIIEQLFGNVLFDPEKPLLASFLDLNSETQLLVAIDNAHYLSSKIIGELLQLYSELNKKGVHLVVLLAFDKSKSATVINLQSAIVNILTLAPLSKTESYQLMESYYTELPPITNSKVKRWIDAAKGIPIQLLAFNENSALKITDSKPLNLKLWVSSVVAASLVLALILYFYRLQMNEITDKVIAKPIPEQANLQQLNRLVEHLNDSPVDTNKTESQEFNSSLLNDAKPVITARPTASPKDIIQHLLKENIEPLILASDSQESETIEPKTTEPKQGQINTEVEKPLVEEVTQPVSNIVSTEKKVKLKKSANEIAVSNKIATIEIDQGISATESEQYPSTYSEQLYLIDNQQFFHLPAEQYVLQLTAVSSESVLSEYLQYAPIKASDAKIYKIKRNEHDWFVVTYGLYASIDEARQSAKAIDSKAWAKSVKVIQSQITLYNRTIEQTDNSR